MAFNQIQDLSKQHSTGNDVLTRVEHSVNRYREFALRSNPETIQHASNSSKPPEQLMYFEHGQLFNDMSPDQSLHQLDSTVQNKSTVS